MSVKYTQIPLDDLDINSKESPFKFNSVFTYDRPEFFSYGKPSTSKYQSGFTYTGLGDSNIIAQTEIGKLYITY